VVEHPPGQATLDVLKETLRHPDPSQLWYQLDEIVRERTYLRHGVELAKGDVVLDVGANVGVAAAFFAVECEAGAVHSFEPVAPIYAILEGNLRSFPACLPHPFGLGAQPGRAEITYYPQATAMSGLHADPAADTAFVREALRNLGVGEEEIGRRLPDRYEAVQMECELRTVSSVIDELSLPRVDLLKIDVERAEEDVLMGVAAQDWPRIRQVVAEVHDEGGRLARIERKLAGAGLEVSVQEEPAMRGTGTWMLYARR
jgi:FkbM family methyltransferase